MTPAAAKRKVRARVLRLIEPSTDAPERRVTALRSRRQMPVVLSVALLISALISVHFVAGGVSSGAVAPTTLRLGTTSIGNKAIDSNYQSMNLGTLSHTNALPTPTPTAVAHESPISSHEVFGFAPYWALHEESTFDVSGYSTIAYFSIGINANGTIDQSDNGWRGFESQQFVDLVNRAHRAGDRVVLAVSCFTQSSLDSLTSTSSAQQRLANEIVTLIRSKNLDGVNLDLEGEGGADRSGLVRLASTVSTSVHGQDPYWQVTLDTYASSAGDPSGFYDIAALSKVVDGFFVMAYQFNMTAHGGTPSMLTDQQYPLATTIAQYGAVAPTQTILGLPTFGYAWPTSGGDLGDPSVGGASIITSGLEYSSGHPVYWDSYTQTAWSSYQETGQWYQAFFEDPTSLFSIAKRAIEGGLAGTGMWALGDDGNMASFTEALDGNAPVVKDLVLGPVSTSVGESHHRVPRQPTTPTTEVHVHVTYVNPRTENYSGVYNDAPYALKLLEPKAPTSSAHLVGEVTTFSTDNESLACLSQGVPLQVWQVKTNSSRLLVTSTYPGDCASEAFELVLSPPSNSNAASPSTTVP